jgi:hypothetical protein
MSLVQIKSPQPEFHFFNDFRKPCNHPNLHGSGDPRKLRPSTLPRAQDVHGMLDGFGFAIILAELAGRRGDHLLRAQSSTPGFTTSQKCASD